MALTPSTMLPLGTVAPDFALPNVVTGQTMALGDFGGTKALLVVFLCNHCPYVIHIRQELARMARDYDNKPVKFVGITSNDASEYPQDSPEATRPLAQLLGFPILYDETQEIAKAFAAACTPDFFLFDSANRLVYRGQLDSTRPGPKPPTGVDLRAAIDAVLADQAVNPNQTPSVGCSIKWKRGNDPAYLTR